MTAPLNRIQLDRSASHTWQLFLDWCSATGHVALPAQPETLAQFLGDHPARVPTHRRRVTVINSAHRQGGLPEPGHAQAVDAALAALRHQRLQSVAGILDECIRQLPVNGWPHGLFGRRDALILTLVRAGLSYREIAALRRGDIRRQAHELAIDTARQWRLGGPQADEHGPVAVYSRWARVQEIFDGYPNARMLAHYFEHPRDAAADQPAPVLSAATAEQPLIVSIDRWGYTPLRPTPMAAQSVSTIARAYLSGRAPNRQPRKVLPIGGAGSAPEPPRDRNEQIVLDERYHWRGITARRRAAAWLTSVGDELDDVGDRAEQLLEQLALIIDEAAASSGSADLPR